jgi:hypothetical protein
LADLTACGKVIILTWKNQAFTGIFDTFLGKSGEIHR